MSVSGPPIEWAWFVCKILPPGPFILQAPLDSLPPLILHNFYARGAGNQQGNPINRTVYLVLSSARLKTGDRTQF